MNRERWIGLAVVLIIVGGWLFFRSRQAGQEPTPVESEQVAEQEASSFAEQLGVILPEDVDKTSLRDVSGGDGQGVATREFSDGVFMHSVLASLPDPEAGAFYEGWLVRPDPFDVVYTGKMRMAKGGYVLDYETSTDLSDHPRVVVTMERVDDQQPETHILEGSF